MSTSAIPHCHVIRTLESTRSIRRYQVIMPARSAREWEDHKGLRSLTGTDYQDRPMAMARVSILRARYEGKSALVDVECHGEITRAAPRCLLAPRASPAAPVP